MREGIDRVERDAQLAEQTLVLGEADGLHGHLGAFQVGPRAKNVAQVDHGGTDVQPLFGFDDDEPDLRLVLDA